MSLEAEVEEVCARCRLPRPEWGGVGEGFPKGEQRYCCRGCAESSGCTCLEAGPAA